MKSIIQSALRNLLNNFRQEPNINTLKHNGLIVGKNFRMLPQCRIDFAHCWHISIGDNVTFAPRVHILAHDASTQTHLGYTKVSNVRIGNNVFVGAGTTILPGVDIGDDCIIGAASLVNRSIPSGHVAAGNPAKILMTTKDYMRKQQEKMTTDNCFDESYTIRNEQMTECQKDQMIQTIEISGVIFVK